MDLNSALIMFVFVTMGGAVAFGLKKLWDIDKKLVSVCQNTARNKQVSEGNYKTIVSLREEVQDNKADCDSQIAVVREEIEGLASSGSS